MKETTYTTRVIEASEGMMLTEAGDVQPAQRTFCRKVFLAVNASPEDWREISEEEASRMEAELSRKD